MAPQSNQARFYLTINDQDLAIEAFASKNFALAQDYQFNIQANSEQQLKSNNLINQAATLTIDNTKIHGIATDIQDGGLTPDAKKYQYTIIINSPLDLLKSTIFNRVYLQKTITELIKKILQPYHIKYQLKLTAKYPEREIYIQYNQSDYDFLTHQLAHFGLFFVFQGSTLIITDDIKQLATGSNIKLNFQLPTGNARPDKIAYASNCSSKILTQSIKLRDYNYNTPEQELTSKTSMQNKIPGIGEHYIYGENFADQQQAEEFGKIRQQAIDWQRQILELKTDCSSLIPGQKIKITNHPWAKYNINFYIISVQAQGDQTKGQVYYKNKYDLTYTNTIKLIPASTPYRTEPYARILNGLHNAIIESPGGDYAYLDEQGRYHIRMPYDKSATLPGQASNPTRLMQPYSGQNYGMHFSLPAGTEVIYTCVNGDINRPILLGVAPNPNTQSPVTAQNPSQNILCTKSYNQLLMDDAKNQERSALFTKNKQNILTLDATKNAHKIYLATQQGDLNIQAAKAHKQKSEASNELQIGNNHQLQIQKAARIRTQNQDIKLQSGRDIKLKSKHNINLEAESKDLTLKSAKNSIIKSKNLITINSAKGNISIAAAKGAQYYKVHKSINLNAPKARINLAQSGAQITIDNNIAIKAKAINITSNQNNLVGNQANLGGAAQPAPLPQKPKVPNIPDINNSGCQLTSFIIKCGHAERVFQLNTKQTQNNILQVIAGDKIPDIVQINCASNCKNKKPKCPSLSITTPQKSYQTQGSTTLNIYSQNIPVTKNFTWFCKQILIPDHNATKYIIKARTCISNETAIIEAIAPSSWQGELALGYLSSSGWGLYGQITAQYNEERWQLGANTTGLSNQLFSRMQYFMNQILPKLESMQKFSTGINIKPPNLKLSGKIQNQEHPNDFSVATIGEISLSMDPFLGITAKANILDWLIEIATGYELGKYLVKIKHQAEQGIGNDKVGAKAAIDIIFSADAEIKGDVAWQKQLTCPWQTSGCVTGEIGLNIEGNAEGEVRIFKCIASAGIKFGLQSIIGVHFIPTTINNDPAVNMQYFFNGLTIYWMVYACFSANHTKHAKSTIPPQNQQEYIKNTYTKHYAIFDSYYWPAKPKIIKLREGGV